MKKIVIYTLAFILSLFAPLVLAFDDGSGRYPSDPKPKPITQKVPTRGAANLAKWLKKGIGGGLLPAVISAGLDALDVVLDPENNRITYNKLDPTNAKCYYSNHFDKQIATNVPDSCNYAASHLSKQSNNTSVFNYVSHKHDLKERYICYFDVTNVRTGAIDNAQQYIHCYGTKEKKEIDYDEAADVVQKEAAKGNPNAQQIIKDADAAEGDDTSKDPNADPNKDPNADPNKDPNADPNKDPNADPNKDPNADPNKDPNADPNKNPKEKEKPDFPDFCDWAKTVCDFIDWAKQEPEQPKQDKDQELDIEEKQMIDPSNFDQDYLVYGGQCPTFNGFTISIGSQSVNLSFDITPLCDFAIAVRPAVIALAYLAGMGIVANAIREI